MPAPPRDTDGDGIVDQDDKCPLKPETRNGYEDEDGCPDKIPRVIRRFMGTIRGITFATASAKIRRRSNRTLNAAVKVLKRYPKLALIIRGHTDRRGTAEYNLDLSLRRAQAVKDYLVDKGIASDRLDVEGLGFTEPVATNRTRWGRARNRRTEFKLRQQ